MLAQHNNKATGHRLNSERVTAVQSLKMRHYTPACDSVKTDVYLIEDWFAMLF